MMAVVLLILRRHAYGTLQVSFAGKTATLALLYAFPLLFLGSHTASYSEACRIVGWAFAIWGSGLYWLAALLYAEQARRLIREDRENGRDHSPGEMPLGDPGGDREAGQR
jgi:cardiolipin synthase